MYLEGGRVFRGPVGAEALHAPPCGAGLALPGASSVARGARRGPLPALTAQGACAPPAARPRGDSGASGSAPLQARTALLKEILK